MVTVTSGSNEATAELEGQTISQVRRDFATALNIPDGAIATLNGEAASDDDELQSGDQLAFVKDTAAKG